MMMRTDFTSRVIFGKGGGGNHLTPPAYQETVPIMTARIHLWKKFKVFFFNRCIPFCCNNCHSAAVYAIKPPYYNTCGGIFERGGGGGGGKSPVSLPPV